ncbi:hypothetical protein AMJ85_07415 [candidate division BRC1 bacterium SM23_51]|nr:MAG: hypothetical protein AMJ85_07415 [candidate division BRC1 bacterium SM23_51]
MMSSVSRRDFLKIGAGAGLAAAVSSRRARGAAKPTEGEPLRVGCIGTGGRGSYLLRQVLELGGVEVVVICDITPENLKEAMDLVEKRSGKRPEGFGAYPYDYRQILSRDDLHCVVMATPCYWHSTMYVDAINAGMHFYGEKPLAITAEGVKAVNDAYKKNPNVIAQIGFQWGAHQARRDIIRQVHEGLIGELIEGSFQRLNGWDTHTRWYADRKLSGDWMLEQAVHEFNLMWMVTQTHPVKCYTVGRSGIIPDRDTTNYYTTILEYPDNLKNLIMRYSHGWIEVSGFSRGGFMSHFVGRKGALDVMGAYVQLREKREDGTMRVEGEGEKGDTPAHLANFFDAVRAGAPDKINCGIANGTGASYIGLLIRQSLEQGRPVTLEETLQDTRKPPVPPV